MSKKRIITGVRPSGRLHIGNYFGAIEPFIKYKAGNEAMIFIADYHALTSGVNGKLLKDYTADLALDILALAIHDPSETIFVQSDVPSVCELATILSHVIGVGVLERNHAYKDAVEKTQRTPDYSIGPTVGLFNYPLLMAADILIYNADIVPIGRDQIQHLEIARDIAKAFNARYGQVFNVPVGHVNEKVVVTGLDGRKMSKSYDNTIAVFEEPEILKKKIMGIKMATGPLEDPENNVLFQLYRLFQPKESDTIKQVFMQSGVQYGKFKEEMISIISNYFREAFQKRKALENSIDGIRSATEIIHLGGLRARAIAKDTIQKVRDAVGLAV